MNSIQFPQIVFNLTLEDIENNLKKYSNSDTFENFDEFLEKAKKSDNSAFVSVHFSQTSPIKTPKELPELADASWNLSLDPNFLSPCKTTSKRKSSNSSNFRFGLFPLESIEENVNEDLLISGEFKSTFNQTSQQISPGSDQTQCLYNREKKIKTIDNPSNRTRRNSKQKKFRSPYSEGISPNRLPAIKKADQTMKILKSFSLSKKRKN